jgi:hypothetical protein
MPRYLTAYMTMYLHAYMLHAYAYMSTCLHVYMPTYA